MGVRFSLIAKKPPHRPLDESSRETDWKAAVETAIAIVARNLGVDFLVPPPGTGGSDRVASHLCEEWLDLLVKEDSVVLMGRTSTCGPGYHAFMIDVVDILGRTHGLHFGEDEDNSDESEYFQNRDFEALQILHAGWLRDVAAVTIEQSRDDDVHGQMIAMPLGGVSPLPVGPQVATQQGWLHLGAVAEIAGADEGKLLELAEGWFPWWERAPSARDYVKTARSLMWVEIPWHAPADDHERLVMLAAARCCERARLIDPAVDVPSAELRELECLLAQEPESTAPPLNEGIGYRRKACVWPLGEGWIISLPGYWYRFEEDDNWGLTFNGQNIWVSTYCVTRGDGSEPQPIEPLELTSAKQDELTIYQCSTAENNCRLSKSTAPDEEGVFTYFLQVTHHDGILLLTFAGTDPSWEKEIPDIAKTVR